MGVVESVGEGGIARRPFFAGLFFRVGGGVYLVAVRLGIQQIQSPVARRRVHLVRPGRPVPAVTRIEFEHSRIGVLVRLVGLALRSARVAPRVEFAYVENKHQRNSSISNALRKHSISCKKLISCFNSHCLYGYGCFKEEV